MQAPNVSQQIQNARADESATVLYISWFDYENDPPPLRVSNARSMIECIRENPTRFDTLSIHFYPLRRNAAVLNAFRNGLPLCTSISTVSFRYTNLGNRGLERLVPAFYNTSVTVLDFSNNRIRGQGGGEVLKDLLVGNNTLGQLQLRLNPIGPEGSIGLGQGLADMNNRLQKLYLNGCKIGNEGLANLVLSMGGGTRINKSLTYLDLGNNNIQGPEGGRQVSLLLQRCFPQLKVLHLDDNRRLGPLGARALAPGLAAAASHCLESLNLHDCGLGNDGVANLLVVPDDDDGHYVNNASSITIVNLTISNNRIQGAEGGRQVGLLLQRWPTLKALVLNRNHLGPLGPHGMAPGGLAAAARQLEALGLYGCGLGNEGVASLVPDGQVNTTLTSLDLGQALVDGENIVALASRCTNLDSLYLDGIHVGPEHRRRLDLLLDRKRLCTEATALGGSPFPVLFRFVEKAHRHEHGLGSIFIILQNDGEDLFYTALNRAMD